MGERCFITHLNHSESEMQTNFFSYHIIIIGTEYLWVRYKRISSTVQCTDVATTQSPLFQYL